MLRLDCTLRRGAFTLTASADIDALAAGLFGPSGAGKTTLLHAVAGLLRPEEGRIEIGGEVVFDSAAKICTPPHRRRLGVVFQDDRLLPHLTVGGNLRFARRFAAPGGGSIDDIASMLEIDAMLDRRPDSLSGGERRRVALARALACNPRMLLLDEPTTGLDLRRRREIIPLLQRVRDAAGMPMLVVSHDLEEVLQLTGTLALIDEGRITGVGALQDLAQRDDALRALAGSGLTSVLPMRVAAREDHALRLEAAGGLSLTAPPGPWRQGATISVGVRAEDIALARSPVEGVSIQNQFPARIAGLHEADGRFIVRIDAGAPLLAVVSDAARRRLDLRDGVKAHCLVKASAVRILGRRAPDR